MELKKIEPYAMLEIYSLPEQAGPVSLDDLTACTDWGWQPSHDLVGLVRHLPRQ